VRVLRVRYKLTSTALPSSPVRRGAKDAFTQPPPSPVDSHPGRREHSLARPDARDLATHPEGHPTLTPASGGAGLPGEAHAGGSAGEQAEPGGADVAERQTERRVARGGEEEGPPRWGTPRRDHAVPGSRAADLGADPEGYETLEGGGGGFGLAGEARAVGRAEEPEEPRGDDGEQRRSE